MPTHYYRDKEPMLSQKSSKFFALSPKDVELGIHHKILERCCFNVYFVSLTPIKSPFLEEISANVILESPNLFYVYISDQFKIQENGNIINLILSLDIEKIEHFNSQFRTSPFEKIHPRKVGAKNILFVFPGNIYPRNMGSHQRAISVLLSLIHCEFNVDILHTGPTAGERERVRPVLSLLGQDIYTYNNRFKGNYSAECQDRLMLNSSNKFDSLIKKKVTPDLIEKLREITENNQYDYILINYAWLLPAANEVKVHHPNIKVVCDTHDIQFYRNGEEKPKSDEAQSEIKWLNKADHLITISHRDEQIVSPLVSNTKVSTFLPTFDYLGRYKFKNHANPFTFGFIGNNMEANVLALKLIIENWWPAIHKFSPESKLYVAGSVCKNEKYQNLVFLRPGIESLGFVDNLSTFYKNIDVLLSPVVVRGGLNFKNAEAIVSGKVLLTNESGAEALNSLNMPFTAETGEDAVAILQELSQSNNQYIEQIVNLSQLAIDTFRLDEEALKQNIFS